jgi:hypothetical protein
MVPKLLTIFFALALVLPIIDAKRCNSCCSCTSSNARATKFQKELTKSKQENDIIKSKTINLSKDFALSVSGIGGKHIGFIHDVFDPNMSIPPNSQVHIEPRIDRTDGFVRIFYDTNHKGLFIDLPIPGNYTANQISLPAKSASSILIPKGYQAVLYTNDYFTGDLIVLTSSQRDFGKFNDKMVSLEIHKIFEKEKEHVAIIHSHYGYYGKKTGLAIGESYRIATPQIGSIMIDPGNEVFIYDNTILTDLYSSSMNSISNLMPFIATVNVQKMGSFPTDYAIFYDDVDYKGYHYILLNHPIVYNITTGKLSSLQIPPNYEVVLYEQQNMQGAHITLSGDIPNLVFYLFNDRAMTIIYQEKTIESNKNAVIYTKPNFTGETRTLPIGYSEISELIYIGSIKVPSGYKVILEKSPVHLLNYERKQTYISDSSDTRYFFDTPLISVFVEIV